MQLWTLLLAPALLAAILSLVMVIRRTRGRWTVSAIAMIVGLLACVSWVLRLPSEPDATDEPIELALSDEMAENQVEFVATGTVPAEVVDEEFVSSRACRECHAEQHASWHDSFHRTMTQIVTPETMVAPHTEVTLQTNGLPYRFWREDEEFWVEMLDQDWEFSMQEQGIPYEDQRHEHLVRRRVVMSTGSHHYQAFWVNNGRGNEMVRFPWVYHIAAERWLPSDAAFVSPPGEPSRLALWNDNCIQCHSVHGQPGPDYERAAFVSQVAEFGIACESCHGPGRKHVEFQRNQAVEANDASDSPDSTIVNPARISHERSSQVCGQCHSTFFYETEEFMDEGFTYRAGDNLYATRMVPNYGDKHIQDRPDLQVGYWRDGTSRLGGREFTAMDDSACYQDGKMSCLSCHSLHEYQEPNDQLATKMESNEACLQCHDSYRESIEAHTHHAADSEGSKCYNCHMPHTSLALLKAIRSHRVDSPTAAMTVKHDRPNACNLCHLDRTLEWTSERLADWYGQEPLKVGPVAQETSATLLYSITGDAVHRSLMAWHMGWKPAQEVSGTHWQVPFLAMLLEDPYSAVRFVAYESLKTYVGFEDFEYNFVGSAESLAAARDRAVSKWRATQSPESAWSPKTLIKPDGSLHQARIEEFLRHRDNRPIELPE